MSCSTSDPQPKNAASSQPTGHALRYRALLLDPGDKVQERPVQIFGNDWREIEKWQELILAKAIAPEAVVIVYETSERQVKLFTKLNPKAEEPTVTK